MCALKVFYEPEQLTSQPPSRGGNMGAAGRFTVLLLIWWLLAAVAPGIVSSNNMRPRKKPHTLTESNQGLSQECWGPSCLGT